MSAAGTLLPDGFEALEPFVDSWSVAGAARRARLRLDSAPEEREAFFLAARDLAPAALDYLDQKALDQFDEREERLMNLMLSLAHVSLAVEIQGDAEPHHASWARFITITRASSDF